MACGVDVAATRVSGVIELIRDGQNGLLCAPDSSQSLAEVLRQWMAGEPGRLGEQARRTIESGYSLQSVAQRTIDMYRELIEARRGRP